MMKRRSQPAARLALYCDESLLRDLRVHSAAMDRSANSVVNDLIRNFLAARGKV
jgi:hypothetical protein